MDKSRDRKTIASAFLKDLACGRVDEAFAEFTHPKFKHHNPHFDANVDVLKTAISENAKRNPRIKLEIKRMAEDGDVVMTHSRATGFEQGGEYAFVHMMRFSKDDKISEMWDVSQELPKEPINQNGAF